MKIRSHSDYCRNCMEPLSPDSAVRKNGYHDSATVNYDMAGPLGG